jgi:hypothetical protein
MDALSVCRGKSQVRFVPSAKLTTSWLPSTLVVSRIVDRLVRLPAGSSDGGSGCSTKDTAGSTKSFVECFFYRAIIERLGLQLDEIVRDAADADFMLNEQGDELRAIHQGDGYVIRALGLISCTRAEITRGDAQSLIMRAETPTYLLNDGSLDVGPPALSLNCHPRADYIADDQRSPNINATIA